MGKSFFASEREKVLPSDRYGHKTCAMQRSGAFPPFVFATSNPHIPFYSVTQIPLEPISRDGLERDEKRPPWIRPIRKKTPSRSIDSISQHSSPEGFPPAEFFVDMGMGSGAQSPSRINTSFPQSPQQPSAAHSSSPAIHGPQHQSNQQYPLSGAISPTAGGSSFMDTPGGMGVDDASMYVSSEEIMAFINDGGVEMASLFQPSTEFTLNHQTLDGGRGTSFGPGSPYSKPDSNGNFEESKSMMGLVSSPR